MQKEQNKREKQNHVSGNHKIYHQNTEIEDPNGIVNSLKVDADTG